MFEKRIVVPTRGANLDAFELVKINSTTIGIVQGAVNSLITLLNGVPLDNDYTNNTIIITSAQQYWLKVNVSSETLVSSEIVNSNPGSDNSTQTSRFLGSVAFSNGVIVNTSNSLRGGVFISICGNDYEWRT